DLDGIRRADEAVLLRKLTDETRTMTVRMGRKLAEAASRIVGDSVLGRRFRARVDDRVPVTYPVALGAVAAAVELSEQDAFAGHQYGTAMVVLSAALRLMRVDHLDGQEILFAVNATAADDYRDVATASLEDMCVFAPVV